MNAMHIQKQMSDMQQAILTQYRPMLERMTADQLKMMTPQQRQRFQAIMADTLADSLKAYPPSEMIHDIAPVYAKYLNKGDIAAMVRFYSSPTGQKFLDLQPKIVSDFMAVMMPKMQDRMQASIKKMQDRIQEMIREERPQPAQEREFKPAAPAPQATPAPAETPKP